MPTADYFSKCVPFPSDQPIFDLECLSYTKLKANDVLESAKLYQASQDCGFFLLNLRGSEEGEQMSMPARRSISVEKFIRCSLMSSRNTLFNRLAVSSGKTIFYTFSPPL